MTKLISAFHDSAKESYDFTTLLMSPYLLGRWSTAFTIQAINYINHTRHYWVLIPEFVLAVVLNSPKNFPTFPLSGLNLVLWNKMFPEKPRFSLLLRSLVLCTDQRFTTVFTRTRQWSRSWSRSIKAAISTLFVTIPFVTMILSKARYFSMSL